MESLRESKQKVTETTIIQESNTPRSSVPRIQLPKFSCRLEEWPAFRDLFSSIIVSDKSLTNVERLQHLKTNVQGEAEQLLRCFPTTDENFPLAWRSLTSHYENQRLLVSSYCNTLLTLPKMKGESAAELRKIYHGMRGVVGSLEGVGRPVFTSPDLFIQIIVNLLDSESRREWEASIRGTTESPSYETFSDFLQGRMQMLVALNPSKSEPAKSKQDDGKARPVRVHHARKKGSGRCTLCQENHFLLFCDSYKHKTPLDRKQFVESQGLCLNCLGKHNLDACNSTRTCTACDQRHHTTLHEVYAASTALPVGSVSSHVARRPRTDSFGVLLATARILVGDRFGKQYSARALIDPDSEVSLVSESLAQRLRVARARDHVVVYGVGAERSATARGSVQITIASRHGGESLAVSA